MTTCTYASYLLTPPLDGFTLTAVSGGTTTTSTNLYYFIYAVTRGGISLGRSLGQIAIAAGQKLRLTIGTLARPTGLDPLGFALGASTTNDQTTVKLLAVCWVKESDQITNKTLPLNFDLTKDQDFILGGTVANYVALPTSSPVNGMIRYVTSESAFYQYDSDGFYSDNLVADWRKVYGWDLYLPNTTTLRSGQKWKGGQDVPINRFEITTDQTSDYYGIISPVWGGEGEPSPSIKIWLTNGLSEGSGELIESGSKLSVVAKINDDSELGSAILSSNLILSPIGIIQRSTGSLSTSLSGSLIWSSGNPFYILTSDLNPGYVIEFSYTTTASVGSGDRVSIHIRNDGPYGTPSNNAALGTCIYADDDKCRIVPNTLGIKRLPGKGTVVTQGQLSSFDINTTGSSGLTFGIEPDTAGQQIAISGIRNGAIACYQPGEDLPITSTLRAIISTEPGTAAPSSWSSPVTVGSNGRIEFTIALPTAIRSDYPDIRIAGNTQAVRNIPQLFLELRNIGTGVKTRFPAVTVESDESQVIVISNLADGTTVSGSIPYNTSNSYGLWGYGTITGNVTGVGSLPSGNYDARTYYLYDSPNFAPTEISHDPNDGCIVELKYSFAEAIELAGYFSTVQLRGTAQARREILNLDSRLFQIVDDPSNDRLTATLPGVPRVFVSEDAPTIDNDSSEGFEAGDFWLKSSDNPVSVYILVDATVVGEADWQPSGGGGSGQGIASVADLATLKAQTGMADNATYLLKVNSASGLPNNIYRYDLASTASGDDNTVIVPTNNTGRYLKVGKFKTTELTAGGDSQFVTAAEKTKLGNVPTDTNTSLSNKSDANHTHLTTKGDLLVGTGSGQTNLAVGAAGTVPTADPGNALGIVWLPPNNVVTTTTSSSYTQPNANSTVVVNVGTTQNFIAGITYIAITDGGRYLVTAIANLTTCTIQYLGGGVAFNTSVSAGKTVTPTGKPGADGITQQTYTNAIFVVPAVDSTVDVTVLDSSVFNADLNIHIESAGYYLITQILSSTSIRIRNKGGTENAAATTNISSGSKVITSGQKGDGSDTKQLKVSSGDTTEGYLQAKLVAGTGVTLTKNNAGANETLIIASIGAIPVLTANKSFKVRLDGSDSNDGSANTSGSAFLTPQKAINEAAKYYLAGFTIDIDVAAGDYFSQGTINIYFPIGSGSVNINATGCTFNKISIVNQVGLCTYTLTGATIKSTDSSLGIAILCENSVFRLRTITVDSAGWAIISRNGYLDIVGTTIALTKTVSGTLNAWFLADNAGLIILLDSILSTNTQASQHNFQAKTGHISVGGATLGTVNFTYSRPGNGSLRGTDYEYIPS